jgi:hypothetical protein
MAQADDWSWDRYRPLLKLQFRQLQQDASFNDSRNHKLRLAA